MEVNLAFVLYFKSVLVEGTFALLCFFLYLSLALITTTVFDLQFKPNHDTISSDESHRVSDHCCYMLFSNALSPTITFPGTKLHNIYACLLHSICENVMTSGILMFKVVRFTVKGFKSNIIVDLRCFRPRSMFASAIMSFRPKEHECV